MSDTTITNDEHVELQHTNPALHDHHRKYPNYLIVGQKCFLVDRKDGTIIHPHINSRYWRAIDPRTIEDTDRHLWLITNCDKVPHKEGEAVDHYYLAFDEGPDDVSVEVTIDRHIENGTR